MSLQLADKLPTFVHENKLSGLTADHEEDIHEDA